MDDYLSLHMTGTYSYRAVSLVLLVLLFAGKTAVVSELLLWKAEEKVLKISFSKAEVSYDRVINNCRHKVLDTLLNVNFWRGILKY